MIPKSQLEQELAIRYKKEEEALEQRIDEAIRHCKGERTVDVDINGIAKCVVDKLKSKYEEGGWKVTRTDDQRDGSTIRLS